MGVRILHSVSLHCLLEVLEDKKCATQKAQTDGRTRIYPKQASVLSYYESVIGVHLCTVRTIASARAYPPYMQAAMTLWDVGVRKAMNMQLCNNTAALRRVI